SAPKLLQYAEVALANRTRNSRESLFELAQSLINRALPQIPDDAYESRLKAGSLLAVDVRTFGHARELFLQMINSCSSVTSRVADTLLSLIEYKPYYSEIVKFLIDIAPERVPEITLRLVSGYKLQRNQALLDKARSILNDDDSFRELNSSQLAQAILSVGSESQHFERYAQRLLNLEAPPEVFFNAIELLISRKSKDFGLIVQLLEYLLLRHPNSRLRVLKGYGQLCNLAEGNEAIHLKKEYLERAITLSDGVQEFLEHAVNVSLTNQLSFLKSNESRLTKASWHRDGEIDKAVLTLIASARSYERRKALYFFLSDHDQLDTHRLIVWIRALFQSDLKLTRQDVSQAQEMLSTVASSIQKEITDGLAKQEVRERIADREVMHFYADSDLHYVANIASHLDIIEMRREILETLRGHLAYTVKEDLPLE